ncbi:LysM domain-containing protein [Flavobacterium laiguense]|uniref:LysM domain-containing protein n=1 Tax=Flavobacterium laiguense TaxID=2169409 RepID=A0A2U1JKH1_9FLAO|nr:LysM domain-containing protein [Flavobacterium laiguense]PWA05479.1 LysM domain-containing protein [Flavobacterium laiguense]
MIQITVLYNQTLQDIVIRYCGTIEALVQIAILNNISITQGLVPGQLIQIPNKDFGNQELVNYFNTNKIQPACGFVGNSLPDTPTGIDYMIIGTDFIVE